VIEIEIER
jgi:hypothetical protein